jgi:transposase-like protein
VVVPSLPLSFRDIEDLLAKRGLDVSYETVRRWVLKFGPLFAKELRRRRHRATSRWHLNEMAVLIGGKRFWLWRGRRRGRGSRSADAAAARRKCGRETYAPTA